MNRDPQPRYRRRRSGLEHRPQYRPRPRRETDPAQSSTIASGDVVEVYNDQGSSYAMAYLEKAMKPGQTFMLFGYYKGVMGDVTTAGTDRNLIPYYKGARANIRRIGSMAEYQRTVSFKSRRYG
jgi:arsenite oxidase large subunit